MAGRALQCIQREKPDKKPLKDINVEMSSASAGPVSAALRNGWKFSRSVLERERSTPVTGSKR